MADVVVVSGEAYGDRPAGPSLRAAGIATALARQGADVAFAAPAGSHAPAGCALIDLDALAPDAPTVVAASTLAQRPALAVAPVLAVDFAGPYLVEGLWLHRDRSPAERRELAANEGAAVASLLAHADLILCAHERGRDLALGLLLAHGLVRPELVDVDPGLARLVAILPFGVPPGFEPAPRPARSDGSLRLVWPGGVWDWLDPLTLVDAVERVRGDGVDVRLELWGDASPDPRAPRMAAPARVRERIRAAGLEDAVELTPWVPYAAVAGRLALADVAVTLDAGGLEARFAARTRLIHALAAGLPTLATAGEWAAELAAGAAAGWTAPAGDVDAVAERLRRLAADRPAIARAGEAALALAADLRYERLIGPLADWLSDPVRRRASDVRPPARGRLRARLRR